MKSLKGYTLASEVKNIIAERLRVIGATNSALHLRKSLMYVCMYVSVTKNPIILNKSVVSRAPVYHLGMYTHS